MTLRPATATARVSSVMSSKSLTASVHSAFCTVVGTHASNEVSCFIVISCSFYQFITDDNQYTPVEVYLQTYYIISILPKSGSMLKTEFEM